jgi:hypothetical protein
MDIGARVGPPSSNSGGGGGSGHTRTASLSLSLSAGLRALLAPSSSMPALSMGKNDEPLRGGGARRASLGGGDVGVDGETSLPVLDVQSAMLAVDLELAPGEERSCKSSRPLFSFQSPKPPSSDTYTITLPSHLPPTHRGRSMKFAYEFIVGTCRAGVSPSSSSSRPSPSSPSGSSRSKVVGRGGVSKVMRMPIRLYNHVTSA